MTSEKSIVDDEQYIMKTDNGDNTPGTQEKYNNFQSRIPVIKDDMQTGLTEGFPMKGLESSFAGFGRPQVPSTEGFPMKGDPAVPPIIKHLNGGGGGKGEPAVPPIIKHLILPGGGITGLVAYGAMREMNNQGLWNIDNIKTIHATSAGSIIAVILSLKYEWKTVDDYLIRRPWHQICDFNMYALIGAITKRGIFDITIIREIFSPLFKGLDISLDITLAEFFELTKIEIFMYTSELNEFELVEISHKTHPEWTVIEAVYASACLPVFLSPLQKDGKYYADGGIFLNYPLKPCLDKGVAPDEILSVCKRDIKAMQVNLTEDASLFDYMLIVLNKVLQNVLTLGDNETHIENEIVIKCPLVSIYDLYVMVSSSEQRLKWIEEGAGCAREYIKKM